MNHYFLFLSLHLIGVVAWFAGLFYLVRLLVYHSEALESNQSGASYLTKQFSIMTQRLHSYIAFPAGLFTCFTGLNLMVMTQAFRMDWFHLKILLILFLLAYHAYTFYLVRRFSVFTFVGESVPPNLLERIPVSSNFLRLYNEVATILLAAIIFTVVIKDISQSFKVFLWFLGILVVLMVVFSMKKKFKKTKKL